jgi:hypothetical protein
MATPTPAPQRLKSPDFPAFNGTAEAVPYKTNSSNADFEEPGDSD